MDMSGNQDDSYISIIIGRKEYLQNLANLLHPDTIHMSELPSPIQDKIMNKAVIDTNQCIVLCLGIDQ